MVTVREWEGRGMAQRRTQDPTLRPSAIADPATVRVAFAYLACATFWLLVGTAAGLLALYVVARISRAPLWSPTLSRISLALWNAAAAAGFVTLSLGDA
jgi:hypothetical protein